MPSRAGEVHSIRLPSGVARELSDRGYKVSKVARQQVLAFLAALKLEEAKQEGAK